MEVTKLVKTGRTVAGVVNSIETLEGAGFLVRRPFPKQLFQISIHFCCWMKWDR